MVPAMPAAGEVEARRLHRASGVAAELPGQPSVLPLSAATASFAGCGHVLVGVRGVKESDPEACGGQCFGEQCQWFVAAVRVCVVRWPS